MDNERREQLKNAWDHESEAPESMEWRDELSPEELETVYDRCVLRTRSGRQYIARLDKDGQIVLEEVG